MPHGCNAGSGIRRFGNVPVVLLVALSLLQVCSSPGLAAPLRAKSLGLPVSGGEKTRILEELRRRQNELVSFRASVLQRRRHPLLRDDMESEGTVSFHKPNRVRWEVRTPEHRVLVLDRSRMTTYFPDRREAVRVNLRDRPNSRMMLDAFSMGWTSSLKDLERRFRIDLYRDDPFTVLKLTPRSRWVSRALSSILLYHEHGEPVPCRVIVTGARGDRSETTLRDVLVNPALEPGTFELTLGPDVRIEEPEADRPGESDGG